MTLAKPLDFSGITVKFVCKMKRMIRSPLRVLAALDCDSKFLADLLTALLSQLLLLQGNSLVSSTGLCSAPREVFRFEVSTSNPDPVPSLGVLSTPPFEVCQSWA